MRDPSPLIVTIDWSAGLATVAVQGELDAATCAQLRERLAWVTESQPRRLVLDLLGVADRFSEQVMTVIAAARRLLPPVCLVEVCSASLTVRDHLEAAAWPGVQVSAAPGYNGRFQPAHSGWSR